MDDLISRQTATKAPEEPTRTFVELVVEYPDPELCTYKEYKGKPYYSIKYIENGETHIGYGTYKPEVLSQFLKEYFISSAQPETYKEKLNEIASALSEKFAYMNTCLNERDIILGYLGVKRSCETHCNTDCTNTKCESHPSFAQPEHNPDDERKIADLHKMVNYLYSRLKEQFIYVDYILSQLKKQWVPVTEELPKENGEYMVTVEYFGWHGEKGRMSTKASYTKTKGWCISDGKVTAWMPLPEPYFTKEES